MSTTHQEPTIVEIVRIEGLKPHTDLKYTTNSAGFPAKVVGEVVDNGSMSDEQLQLLIEALCAPEPDFIEIEL